MTRPQRRFCWLVILVAIAGLSCSLATRTFRLEVDHGKVIQSGESQAMRQHLNRDAVQWAPPAPVSIALDAPVFYPRFAPAGPPLPRLFFEQSLYNRPPPFHS